MSGKGEKVLRIASHLTVMGTCAVLLVTLWRLSKMQDSVTKSLQKSQSKISKLPAGINTALQTLSMVYTFYTNIFGKGTQGEQRRRRRRRRRRVWSGSSAGPRGRGYRASRPPEWAASARSYNFYQPVQHITDVESRSVGSNTTVTGYTS